MTQDISLEYDVVVVGGGPIGTLTANFLGQYGVRTLLVDREPDVINIPRAVGLCEEGSRILNAAGLMQHMEADLIPIDDVFFRDKQLRPQFRIGVNQSVSGNRRLRTLHQPDVEHIFRKHLENYDCVDFLRSTECLQFNDLGDQVQLTIRCFTGTDKETLRHIRCRYLLACDGARSPIRKMLPTEFRGRTYAQDWLVIDVEKDPITDRSEAYFICDPYRPAVTLPTPNGGRRWEFVVRDNESSEFICSDDAIRELLKPWGNADDMQICRKTVYTFHAVVSRKFQVGNVFLLGDAAHLTPPFAGQGLMAGMRDAYNLTWKLAHVLEGKLPQAILQSYDSERRPQADLIVRLAQVLGMVILPQNPLLARLRDMTFAMGNRLMARGDNQQRANMHKMRNNILGYKAIRYWASDPDELLTGFDLPQFRVSSADHENPTAFDNLLGSHHYIIGFQCAPRQFLTPLSAQLFQAMGGRTCGIQSAANADQPLPVDLQVCDSDGHYQQLLDHGRRLLIIRPDGMVVRITSPQSLDKDLANYMDSLGLSALFPDQDPALQTGVQTGIQPTLAN